jgi:predicted HicB family RNase H-like nuclease
MQVEKRLARKDFLYYAIGMTTKRGRPPIDPAKRASEMVPVRMTQAERAQFEQAAAKADQTLSAWIRACLTKAAGRSPKR